MKANPCNYNEEHKQELKRMQLNWSDSADEWLISQVGVSQTDLAANCSWQNNLSKTQTVYEDSRVVQDPLDTPLMGSNTIQGPKTERRRRSAGSDSGCQLFGRFLLTLQ